MRKQLADMLPVIEQLTSDVKLLKAAPAPAKAAARAIGKTDDIAMDPEVKTIAEKLEALPLEQRAFELMKVSLAHGVPAHPAHLEQR